MIVVNFWGGPGSGKSSIAAKLFAYLKTKQSINCELVTEFAKDLVWSNRFHCLVNQPYVSCKQFYKLEKLNGKIDIAITDSPIPIGIVYAEDKYKDMRYLKPFLLELFYMFDNVNFYIERNKKIKYKGEGRNQQDLKEAIKYDKAIENLIDGQFKQMRSYLIPNIRSRTLCKDITKILEIKLGKKIK